MVYVLVETSMTVQTRSKAVGGGVAGNFVNIALWLLTLISGWDQIPDIPKASIIALVSGGIGYLSVFYAPANRAIPTEGE